METFLKWDQSDTILILKTKVTVRVCVLKLVWCQYIYIHRSYNDSKLLGHGCSYRWEQRKILVAEITPASQNISW